MTNNLKTIQVNFKAWYFSLLILICLFNSYSYSATETTAPKENHDEVGINFPNLALSSAIAVIEDFSNEKIIIGKKIDLDQLVWINIRAPWPKVLEEIGNEAGFKVEKINGKYSIYKSKDNSKKTGLITNKDGLYFTDTQGNHADPLKLTKGEMHYANGIYYSGEIKNGRPNGLGQLFNREGKVWYEGQWLDGKWHGFGRINTIHNNLTGRQYTGGLKNHSPHGVGKLLNIYKSQNNSKTKHFISVDFFEGRFKNGIPSGYGYETSWYKQPVTNPEIKVESIMILVERESRKNYVFKGSNKK